MSKNELKFATEEEALQYLANITSKRIKIATKIRFKSVGNQKYIAETETKLYWGGEEERIETKKVDIDLKAIGKNRWVFAIEARGNLKLSYYDEEHRTKKKAVEEINKKIESGFELSKDGFWLMRGI
jgi:hypothetical protein